MEILVFAPLVVDPHYTYCGLEGQKVGDKDTHTWRDSKLQGVRGGKGSVECVDVVLRIADARGVLALCIGIRQTRFYKATKYLAAKHLHIIAHEYATFVLVLKIVEILEIDVEVFSEV